MKQILRLAQLRGQTAATNEAMLLALRLSWVLVQSQAQQTRVVLTAACEQWAHALCQDRRSQAGPPAAAGSPMTVSSWAVTALAVATLRLLVQASWTFAHLRECLPDLQRFLCSRRRQRDHQEGAPMGYGG